MLFDDTNHLHSLFALVVEGGLLFYTLHAIRLDFEYLGGGVAPEPCNVVFQLEPLN